MNTDPPTAPATQATRSLTKLDTMARDQIVLYALKYTSAANTAMTLTSSVVRMMRMSTGIRSAHAQRKYTHTSASMSKPTKNGTVRPAILRLTPRSPECARPPRSRPASKSSIDESRKTMNAATDMAPSHSPAERD